MDTTKKSAHRFSKKIISSVSRTFAISIKLLPGALGNAVITAYLLCRIADTIEDDNTTPANTRQQLLIAFTECYPNPDKIRQFTEELSCIGGDSAYLELLKGAPMVFEELDALPKQSADIVWRWTKTMALGMREFLQNYPGGIYIKTMEELRRYCYFVAGTVGHMLTELFYAHSRLISKANYEDLLGNCEAFAEALQLVNILKDIAWDFEHENEVFIPEEILTRFGSSQRDIINKDYRPRNFQALQVLIATASQNLDKAFTYIYTLPRMAMAIRLFCLVPVMLAVATLRELQSSQAMLQKGGGVKISRKEVKKIIAACILALASNTLISKLRKRIQEKVL